MRLAASSASHTREQARRRSLTVGTERCVNASHQRLREQQVEGDRAESGQASQGSYHAFFLLYLCHCLAFALVVTASHRLTSRFRSLSLPFLRDMSASSLRSPPRLVMCRKLASPRRPPKVAEHHPEKHGISPLATSASRLLPSQYACLSAYTAKPHASEQTPTRLHAYAIPTTWPCPTRLPAFLISPHSLGDHFSHH